MGEGNIRNHSQQRRRYRCTVCGKTFSERAGTPLFRRRTDETTIVRVITLVSHGCPIAAVEAAFGLQAQTVREWVSAAGAHAQAIHHDQVVQQRDLGQVQADEVRVRTQAGVVWMALAISVHSRLWLAGAVSKARDAALLKRLLAVVVQCALFGPLLFVCDGLNTYVEVVRKTFRTRVMQKRGRPRLVEWPDLVLAQVVKQRDKAATSGPLHRLVWGTTEQFLTLLWSTPGCQVLNTSYIERLNGTFRSHLAPLGRRTRHAARRIQTIEAGMYLIGTVYNFCSPHHSLTLETGCVRTPAMAAGITDHVWTVGELLRRRLPPPLWEPPRHPGRRSRHEQALIQRWCRSTV